MSLSNEEPKKSQGPSKTVYKRPRRNENRVCIVLREDIRWTLSRWTICLPAYSFYR